MDVILDCTRLKYSSLTIPIGAQLIGSKSFNN